MEMQKTKNSQANPEEKQTWISTSKTHLVMVYDLLNVLLDSDC